MADDGDGLAGVLDADAAAAWDRTVRGFLAHSASAPEHLGRVLERAPRFALGWAAKGLFTLLLGRSELRPAAAAALERARRALAEGGGTEREHAFAGALALYFDGRPRAAAAAIEAVLERHPEDALALKLAQAIRFVLGDRRAMLRSARRAIGRYGPGHPHGGYALGCLAFALEENGAYAEAEAAGKAALERAPDDAWGLHAVAHVHDMTGRDAEGVRWLEARIGDFGHCNNFGYHLWWHLALFHLDLGDTERVLALYDGRVRADRTDDYRDVANAVSLLLRLEIEGVDVGARWDELAALAAGRVEDGALVFADLHYLLALQRGGRGAEADALVARLAADAWTGGHDMHEVAALAGLPCARGLTAFRAGRYDAAFEGLRRVLPDLSAIGGSHAQRDLFSRLTIEAALRARRWRDAEAALAERARRRGAEDGFTHRRRAAIARVAAAGLAAE